MGRSGGIKMCPSTRDYQQSDPATNYEANCGGFGYNLAYVA